MKDEIDRILARTPSLKAKEIAKELGVPRKDVNACLYRNEDRYVQDSEYRWSLTRREEREITLPRGWVTADVFEFNLRQAEPLSKDTPIAVTVTFQPNSKPMIDCTARLLALANQLIHQGSHVTLDFTAAEPTRTYLNRAGFFDHLHNAADVLPERPTHSAAKRYRGKSDTLLEFGAVDPRVVNDEMIGNLTDKFVQQSTDEYRIAAFTIFSELINNVVDHSETPLVGFAGLQKYKGKRKHIQTVVSDSGIGIAKTLRPALRTHYPGLHGRFGQRSLESDMGLVAAAMSEGQISRFGGARGLGFKSTRAQAAVKFDAQFSVRQERFCLRFVYRSGELAEIKRQTDLTNLLGTHICFDFYLD
jgi:hypothetical protein